MPSEATGIFPTRRVDLMLAIPHTNRSMAYEDHRKSLRLLVDYTERSGIQVGLAEVFSSDISGNRNLLVEKTLQSGSKWILFIDDDMLIPEDSALKLMKHDRDISTGFCVLRRPPFKPSAFVAASDNPDWYRPIETWPENDLMEIKACGAAFLLIKTKIFSKLEKPYFSFCPHHDSIMGEDVYFCRKATTAGFKIWLDTGVNIGHLGDYPYTIHDHLAYKKEQEELKEKNKCHQSAS